MPKTLKEHNDFIKKSGDLVRHYRKTSGLSQSEVGKELGITFQQVQKYERGTNELSAFRFTQLAVVFGKDPCEMLSEVLDKAPLPNHHDDSYLLLKYADQIPAHLRVCLVNFARTLAATTQKGAA